MLKASKGMLNASITLRILWLNTLRLIKACIVFFGFLVAKNRKISCMGLSQMGFSQSQ